MTLMAKLLLTIALGSV